MLEAKRRECQILLGSVLIQIFSRYPKESPEDQSRCAHLFGPIERQNEKLRALYKERNRGAGAEPIADIEPEIELIVGDDGVSEAA